MTVESDNIITLLEEMTPLLVYIFSCILHRSGREFREMRIKLVFKCNINFRGLFEFC